jgi:hypothetical protein
MITGQLQQTIWVCLISVETVPKVGKSDQTFSTKPSGRSNDYGATATNNFSTVP